MLRTAVIRKLKQNLQCMKDCCGSVNLPPELLQNVIHFVHHLLADGASGLDGLEAFQKLKGSVGTAQLPAHVQKLNQWASAYVDGLQFMQHSSKPDRLSHACHKGCAGCSSFAAWQAGGHASSCTNSR